MIGKLTGLLDEYGEDYLILDVQGVGYLVHVSNRTLSSLPANGSTLTLYIETYVREDAIRLFGFPTKSELQWFRLLQSVQGVGAKVALAVLATLSVSELANAISLRDTAMVSRAPGIGKKVAERIVTELKNKVPSFSVSAGSVSSIEAGNSGLGEEQPILDAISALANLGYSRDQAATAISAILKTSDQPADSASLIRLGLKELSKK